AMDAPAGRNDLRDCGYSDPYAHPDPNLVHRDANDGNSSPRSDRDAGSVGTNPYADTTGNADAGSNPKQRTAGGSLPAYRPAGLALGGRPCAPECVGLGQD